MFLKIVILCYFLVQTLGDEYHPRFKSHNPTKNTGEGVDFWKKEGKDELINALNVRSNLIEKKAKNIIQKYSLFGKKFYYELFCKLNQISLK